MATEYQLRVQQQVAAAAERFRQRQIDSRAKSEANRQRELGLKEEARLRQLTLIDERRQQGYNLAKIEAERKVVPTTSTSTARTVMPSWTPPESYDIPEYTPYIPGATPSYSAPVWDEGAIESLTQRNAAPGLRGLREQVQKATNRKYENVQVGRMTLREALQGYGAGIGSVLGGAGTAARGEYGQKYGIEADVAKTNYGGMMAQWQGENVARSQEAMTNYQSELEKRKTSFNTAWDKWKSSIGREAVTTTR